MRENWYLLEDGRIVDPNDVAADSEGVLRHKSGTAVARQTSGDVMLCTVDDPEGERSKAKDMKPEKPKPGYKTRETKAE